MTHRWLGEGSRDDTNAPISRDHNQQARGTQLVAGEGGAHSSNLPSRMCSKEKGRNLKPVPL